MSVQGRRSGREVQPDWEGEVLCFGVLTSAESAEWITRPYPAHPSLLSRTSLFPILYSTTMRRDVRVLLVGDGELHIFTNCSFMHIYLSLPWVEGVGKSTIVTSLIKEEYVDNVSKYCMFPDLKLTASQVQHVVPEVTIPPEVTPENVTTYIVDSSGGS